MHRPQVTIHTLPTFNDIYTKHTSSTVARSINKSIGDLCVANDENCPGACDLDPKLTTPELSVAVGSVHVMVVPDEPNDAVSVISSRHAITGGMVLTGKS